MLCHGRLSHESEITTVRLLTSEWKRVAVYRMEKKTKSRKLEWIRGKGEVSDMDHWDNPESAGKLAVVSAVSERCTNMSFSEKLLVFALFCCLSRPPQLLTKEIFKNLG